MINTPAFDGQRLRQLRKSRGLPAHRLAEQANLSTRHLWRLEAGTRPRVAAVTLARIASALDTSVDYLMGLSDQANVHHRKIATPRFDGQRMGELRKQRGLSAEALARKANVSTRHIWRLQTGKRPNVAAVTLARIALALDSSVDYLVGLSDTPDRS